MLEIKLLNKCISPNKTSITKLYMKTAHMYTSLAYHDFDHSMPVPDFKLIAKVTILDNKDFLLF